MPVKEYRETGGTMIKELENVMAQTKVGDYITREEYRAALLRDPQVLEVHFTCLNVAVKIRASNGFRFWLGLIPRVPDKGLKKINSKQFQALPDDVIKSSWEG